MLLDFQYIESGGERLAVSLHPPAQNEEQPVVIICHGFIGTRIGVDRLFVQAAERFAAEGMGVVRFDYVGCGESSGEYGSNRFSDFIRQTQDIIQAVTSFPIFQHRPVVLLGHSLGGAVATITAALDRRVDRLVLWAPVAYPYEELIRIATQGQGRVEGEGVDYHGYRLPPAFFASLQDAHPLEAAAQVSGDVLLIHGIEDQEIPVTDADVYEKVFLQKDEWRCHKWLLPQADHTFSQWSARQQLFHVTSSWLAGRVEIAEGQ
ncbi:alpha/beta fold hydrolase [Geobacillus sp. MR]|uniref:alpha/beta hydrolase n=1 Tax=Geobacillus sp. MR TaxID=2508875 RepID=UPI00148C6028|nr:alpha/beta fold hydrolase [Geobacillus sp. MR]NNU87907.1 alpha/beta fold hydrolase [Geobacillus sp. MR]